MLSMTSIDPLDARILLALDDEPDASILSLSRGLGVARNTIQARLRRLAATVLGDFGRRVLPSALGYRLLAFVFLEIRQSSGDSAAEELVRLPEVVEIHSTTGDADLLVRVVAKDTTDLYRVTNSMLAIPGVTRSSTAISLVEVLPLRMRPLIEAAGRG